MNEHRLSRVLGYDGIRAERKAHARGESPAHEAKESAEFERGEKEGKREALGHDGDDGGFVSKAIARAKEVVGLGPKKKAPPKKPAAPKKPDDLPQNKRQKQIQQQGQAAESPDAPPAAPDYNTELGQDGKNWIKGAIKHPGALHRQMGVPQGQKIPKAKLAAAASKGGTLGKRARLAETLGKMHHDGVECGKDGKEHKGYTLKGQISKEGDAFDGTPSPPKLEPPAADGGKMQTTMHEFKHGQLHSGSKTGPKVTSRKQAIAIGLNQARKAGEA